VGNDGETLVADSSTSTGLRYQGSMAAGKNFIINGGFDIWQRGTSFSTTNGGSGYNADRWTYYGGNTGTITQSTALLLAGSQYSFRFTSTGASGTATPYQLIETSNTVQLQGKTVTFSAYVAGTAGKTASLNLWYSTVDNDGLFGSWTQISATTGSSVTTSGSYQRLVYTYAIPSTARSLRVSLEGSALASTEFISWSNAQLELGSVATAFTRAGGTIQGELAACQRYYYRFGGSSAYQRFAAGLFQNSTQAWINVQNPVPMRAAPTSVDFSNLAVYDGNSIIAMTGISAVEYANNIAAILVSVASGGTQYRPVQIFANNTFSAFLGFSAEL
jgi:hypothetical protein